MRPVALHAAVDDEIDGAGEEDPGTLSIDIVHV